MITTPYVHKLNNGQLIRFYARRFEDISYVNKANTYSEKFVESIAVKAPLPENISLRIGNEVNQLFSAFQLKSDLVQLAGATGVNVDRGFSQREYWRGPENSEMSVELHFNAYYSGYIDVMRPTQKLLLLGASRETSFQGGEKGTGFIGDFDEIWGQPTKAIVMFGNYFYHNNMIIKSVEVSYSNKLDNEFNPMSAVVNVTMIPTDPMGFAVMHGGSRYGGMTDSREAVSDYEQHKAVSDNTNVTGEQYRTYNGRLSSIVNY